jgi:hypothetical protein
VVERAGRGGERAGRAELGRRRAQVWRPAGPPDSRRRPKVTESQVISTRCAKSQVGCDAAAKLLGLSQFENRSASQDLVENARAKYLRTRPQKSARSESSATSSICRAHRGPGEARSRQRPYAAALPPWAKRTLTGLATCPAGDSSHGDSGPLTPQSTTSHSRAAGGASSAAGSAARWQSGSRGEANAAPTRLERVDAVMGIDVAPRAEILYSVTSSSRARPRAVWRHGWKRSADLESLTTAPRRLRPAWLISPSLVG